MFSFPGKNPGPRPPLVCEASLSFCHLVGHPRHSQAAGMKRIAATSTLLDWVMQLTFLFLVCVLFSLYARNVYPCGNIFVLIVCMEYVF